MKNYYSLILFLFANIILVKAQNCNYGPIIGPTSVKPYTTVTYAVTNINGLTYNWWDTCGIITSGQGTNIINIYWGDPCFYGNTAEVGVSVTNCTFTSLLVSLVTGIDEPIWANDIRYFPNPVQDFFNISWPKDASVNKLIIQDPLGRTVKAILPSTNENQIDMKYLSSGVYFLTLYGDGVKIIKIMKE